MAGISHLLFNGETIEHEEHHVNARLSGGRRAAGSLYLTNRRMIFHSRLLLREIVQDTPYGAVVDVSYKANLVTAARLTVTTEDGGTSRYALKGDPGPALLSTIRAHQ